MRITMSCAPTDSSAVQILASTIDLERRTGTRFDTYPDIGPPGGGPLNFSGSVDVFCPAPDMPIP